MPYLRPPRESDQIEAHKNDQLRFKVITTIIKQIINDNSVNLIVYFTVFNLKFLILINKL